MKNKMKPYFELVGTVMFTFWAAAPVSVVTHWRRRRRIHCPVNIKMGFWVLFWQTASFDFVGGNVSIWYIFVIYFPPKVNILQNMWPTCRIKSDMGFPSVLFLWSKDVGITMRCSANYFHTFKRRKIILLFVYHRGGRCGPNQRCQRHLLTS